MRTLKLKNGEVFSFSRMEFMGIINVTPDSFYEASRVTQEEALRKAEQMIKEGATFLDIGGESTRPGAAPVTPEEEAGRVCPVIKKIKDAHPDVLVSVDTYHAYTAKKAIEAGVDIINDISAMTFDPQMLSVVKEADIPVVLMHCNGRPDHMQDNPTYEDVTKEVHDFLRERIETAESAGIDPEKILIDIGIGFGKTKEHCLELLDNLDAFYDLGKPHLMAVSRKSCLDHSLEKTIERTLDGAKHGIELARVHDVKANADPVRQWEAADKTAVIAFGSNLGNSRELIQNGIDSLKELGTVEAVSTIIESEPYGVTDQPKFLNGALILKTKLTPYRLIDELNRIEAEQGRVRTLHWGPRTLDLDIIYYDDLTLNTPRLRVPHPDRLNRPFVMDPIKEIAPRELWEAEK